MSACLKIAAIYVYIFNDAFLSKIYITVIRKKRFPAGKIKIVWEASLRCHIFC